MSYFGITEEQTDFILQQIGVKSTDDLFSSIPENICLKRPLDLPPSMDDFTLQNHLKGLAETNNTSKTISFLGAGCYDHYIPPVVDYLANQGAFVTAYTPYQAEASQGSLQIFYEFQTMICQITGMDVANASMYDGSSAVAEAVLMARDLTSKSKVLIGQNVHPDHALVTRTYLSALPMTLETIPTPNGIIEPEHLEKMISADTAAVVIQQPDFFGLINPLDVIAPIVKKHGAMLIVVVDPISLGLLKPPGEFDVDIVVGEGQPLGIPPQFGGPYLGLMAVKEKYLRRIPGRLIGQTVDEEGKRAFCLTLQTREQHIRRERATSNICSNEGLMAIRAAVYLSTMGKNGLKQVANLCFQKAHYAADKISKLEGYEIAFSSPFFREFVVRCRRNRVETIMAEARKRNILAGVGLGCWFEQLNDCLLVAVTEKRTKEQIDLLIEVLDSVEKL